ncbi:hypothetical protein CKO31_19600 [Thiohalocapsa halophila]|uniref:Uncharacterized protein n=1 Tax=Thiohalocapsa halophila TaxID=69359 RepID=A0ABS1CLV6_9GAMM|nr:hypothetical protein [Thiohalocapsa halophila]MBK1632913.1 hypothetical protein [Thiohalocapsa halophila]
MSALTPFYWFLLVLLASRLFLILRDAPLNWRQAVGLSLVQAAGTLAAAPSLWLAPLLAVIPAANLIGVWWERRDPPQAGLVRLAVLVVREMDERDFAEYVLIGTLMSMASAVLVAEVVKALLP